MFLLRCAEGSTINCREGSRCLGPSEGFYEPSVRYTPKPQDLKNGCGGPKGDDILAELRQ
jgi:hypothetical protein